jgi:hypothetical protein
MPAALVGLRRTPLLAGTVAGLLAWLPVAMQNQYFVYHATALPVLGAVCLYGVLRRTGPLFALPILALSGWTYYVLTTDPDWRMAQQAQLFTIAAVTAGVMVVLSLGCRAWPVLRPRLAGPRPVATLLAPVVLLATWLPAIARNAAESVTLTTRYNTTQAHREATTGQLASAKSLRTRIGADTPVTYLTFGTTNYVLGNPSTLRVPHQCVPAAEPHHPAPGGYADVARQRPLPDRQARRARGLGHPVVPDAATAPEVRAAFAATFDCERGFTSGRIRVCPRRT